MLHPKNERKTMTSPIVLDGKVYAAEINEDLKKRVASLIEKTRLFWQQFW